MSRIGSDDSSFDVVFVCTGNRARSALAEAFYRRYADGLPTRALSFGTQDVGSIPALPDAIGAAAALGVNIAEHRSRALGAGDLSGADLVLGFEPFHVAAAVVDGAADGARTFLLGDVVHLLPSLYDEGDPLARARDAVDIANLQRGAFASAPPRVIADPLGRPAEVMATTASEIDGLVRELVYRLFGERAA